MMIESRMKGIDSIHGKSNKRKRYKLRTFRIHKKIRNVVDERQQKLARWLCENYHVVFVKTKRCFRKIHPKTARQIMAWSRFRFPTSASRIP